MERSEAGPSLIRFGVFELSAGSGELRKNGIRLKLGEQPLRILLYLTARPGEIVTREELQKLLWGEGTLVDSEHGLNAAINKLRETLNDSASAPRYVETVPRRGYRFVAEVVRPAAPNPVEAAAPSPSTSVGGSGNHRWWIGAAVLLLLVLSCAS